MLGIWVRLAKRELRLWVWEGRPDEIELRLRIWGRRPVEREVCLPWEREVRKKTGGERRVFTVREREVFLSWEIRDCLDVIERRCRLRLFRCKTFSIVKCLQMQMIYRKIFIFPNILQCLVQRKKPKNKTTTNPTIFSGHHKPNKAQPSPPSTITNHHQPNKNQPPATTSHHQPLQTNKISSQIQQKKPPNPPPATINP